MAMNARSTDAWGRNHTPMETQKYSMKNGVQKTFHNVAQIPHRGKHVKSVRVTSEDYKAIKELAQREGRTIAGTLRLIIKNALGGM